MKARPLPMTTCFPGPCRCCVCQGIHCFLPHPGHDHRSLERRMPLTPDDACVRCGGSMEATGGKPTDGTRLCQACVLDDWLAEEANG